MTIPNQTPVEATPQQPATIRYEFPAKKPVVTYTLLAITILSFLLQQLSTLLFDYDAIATIFAKSNALIYQGQVWRLLTPALVHADIIHIGFNMYALYIIGQRLERVYGHQRFLSLYILSAIAGNLFSFYLTPNPSLGASTAIFGLLAAEAVYIYNNRRFFPQAKKVLTNLGLILAFNLFYGFTVPNIDIWGHLGGFLGGLGFAWFAGPLVKIKRVEAEIHLLDQHIGSIFTKVAVLEFAIIAALTAFRIIVHP